MVKRKKTFGGTVKGFRFENLNKPITLKGKQYYELFSTLYYGVLVNSRLRDVARVYQHAIINDLPNLSEYDNIILIYPLWWHTLPMAVESVLKNNDLSGKVIIPIVTHGGGGIGESVDNIKSSTNAKVLDCLSVYSSDIPASRQIIADFLKRIKESL